MSVFTCLWKLCGISGRLPRLPPSLRVLHWGASRRRGTAPDEVVVLQVAVARRLYITPHVHAVSSSGVSLCLPMRRCCAADLPAEPYTACCHNAGAPAAAAEACDSASPHGDQPRSSAPGSLPAAVPAADAGVPAIPIWRRSAGTPAAAAPTARLQAAPHVGNALGDQQRHERAAQHQARRFGAVLALCCCCTACAWVQGSSPG
jgi:hypothetical protein